MPIVVSGGYYTDPFHPPELADQTEDEIAAALAEAATAERWGAFGEIASSAEMTPGERKVFHAIGKAHLLTNVPIFTHTANGLEAEVQLDIFESLGVPPANVAIGHMGGLDDPEATVHRRLAERGAFVGFDRPAAARRPMDTRSRWFRRSSMRATWRTCCWHPTSPARATFSATEDRGTPRP